jgi:hypothetical protein
MNEIIVIVGKAPEGLWRRENLLKVKNCIEKADYHEITFQYVDHAFELVKQIKLTYRILK